MLGEYLILQGIFSSQNTYEQLPEFVWTELSMGNGFHAKHIQAPINGIHYFKSHIRDLSPCQNLESK